MNAHVLISTICTRLCVYDCTIRIVNICVHTVYTGTYVYLCTMVYPMLPAQSLRCVALFPLTAADSPTPLSSTTHSTQTETSSGLLASPLHIQATQGK